MDESTPGITQLVYAAWGCREIDDSVLRHFRTFSGQHFPGLDVTGALIAGCGDVLHLLEGPARSVETLFEVMSNSPYLRQPVPVHRDDGVRCRLFPNRPMAIIRMGADIPDAEVARLWQTIDISSLICGNGMTAECMALLRALSQQEGVEFEAAMPAN